MLSRKNLITAVMAGWITRMTERRASAQTPASPAQPPKDPQSTFEPRTGPGEGQKWMERAVGEWEVRKTISPPGRPPSITKGTCKQSMAHLGRFLKSEFVFEEKDGTKTDGLGMLGFDPATGLFTSVWTDSRSTRMSLRASEGKFDGDNVVLYGRALEGAPPARKSRTNAHLEENGRILVHRQYAVGQDGKEFVIMELYMTRKEPKKG